MRLLSPLLLALALGGCATHVVSVEAADPSGTNPLKATFDVPRFHYVAAEGNRVLVLRLDTAEVWRLDVAGKKAWRREGAKLVSVPWNEAAAALGLPLEPVTP
ncbi:MAG TPA: hypothetical protein VJP77_05875 [Planctomycetota bacterium]|nr:hypothetical protein [Planctomycetota bacterium]